MEPDDEAIIEACKFNNVELLRQWHRQDPDDTWMREVFYGSLRKNMYKVIHEACASDDVQLLRQPLQLHPDDDFFGEVYLVALRCNAPLLLRYTLDNGAAVRNTYPQNIGSLQHDSLGGWAKSVLETLLAHQWDINSRKSHEPPLLWYLVNDEAMVRWCVDRGALVDVPDIWDYPTVLDRVARFGTVETFKYLQAQGAPIGKRVLQCAADRVCHPRPKGDEESSWAIFRYVLYDLRLDPNGSDKPNRAYSGLRGTPLRYVVKRLDCDVEVVRMLLDAGADPMLDNPECTRNQRYIDAVKEWQKERGLKKLEIIEKS